ncbi:MAG TPA: hypothetical protein VK694_06190 [Verrucomicrobiae bacterium]|nr:hypothetical protein [Verrucomicrobiae bacterium]
MSDVNPELYGGEPPHLRTNVREGYGNNRVDIDVDDELVVTDQPMGRTPMDDLIDEERMQ